MGAVAGVLIVAGVIAFFTAVNMRAGRRPTRSSADAPWVIDPQTGQPVPPAPGSGHHGGHHGGAGGHHGGGQLGGGHGGGGHFGGGGGDFGGGGHHG